MQTKQTKRPADKHRQRSNVPQRSASKGDIVYTPPKPFNRNRFLLRLATVVAVVLAVVLGMSIFFKVKNVYVSGSVKYSAWDVKEASGIQEGDNLLTLNRAQVGGKIRTNLPYVATVRVGIKLPDTVNIEITELDVVYAIQAKDNSWWLINSSGKVVDRSSASSAKSYTQILGVSIQLPEIGQMASAAEPVQETTAPQQTDEEGTAQTEAQDLLTVLPTVSAAQQLEDALLILQQLESNGIIGKAASVDVTDIRSMELWYGQYYQVMLGDDTQLAYKIASMKAAIEQMGELQSGVLDVSFTTWPNEVGYTPF